MRWLGRWFITCARGPVWSGVRKRTRSVSATSRPCVFFTNCDDTELSLTGVPGNVSKVHVLTNLTPGTNTFSLVYRINAIATASFSHREITVIPF